MICVCNAGHLTNKKKGSYVKELLRCAALCIITSLWGCLPPMPAVPAEVTFVDRAPLYSWTGTWRGRGGTIFDIVQQGNRFSVSGPLANASAQLGGSRAQGTMTHANMPGMIGTFDMVLSNDGRYARGTVRWAGIPLEDLWTRISESPQPLAEDIAQTEGVKPG